MYLTLYGYYALMPNMRNTVVQVQRCVDHNIRLFKTLKRADRTKKDLCRFTSIIIWCVYNVNMFFAKFDLWFSDFLLCWGIFVAGGQFIYIQCDIHSICSCCKNIKINVIQRKRSQLLCTMLMFRINLFANGEFCFV